MQASSTTAVEQLADEMLGFVKLVTKGVSGDAFAAAAALDISLSQLRALFLLDAADHDLALGELATAVGLSVAAAGRAVDGLAKAGLVTRTEDAVDRRIKRLATTDEGRATLEQIAAARRSALLTFVESLSEAEREQFSLALAPLSNRYDAATGCWGTTS